jgi:hypothetical protein
MAGERPSSAEPPETDDDLRIEPPKSKAAGLASVRSAFAHMHKHGHSIPSAMAIRSRLRFESSDR